MTDRVKQEPPSPTDLLYSETVQQSFSYPPLILAVTVVGYLCCKGAKPLHILDLTFDRSLRPSPIHQSHYLACSATNSSWQNRLSVTTLVQSSGLALREVRVRNRQSSTTSRVHESSRIRSSSSKVAIRELESHTR